MPTYDEIRQSLRALSDGRDVLNACWYVDELEYLRGTPVILTVVYGVYDAIPLALEL